MMFGFIAIVKILFFVLGANAFQGRMYPRENITDYETCHPKVLHKSESMAFPSALKIRISTIKYNFTLNLNINTVLLSPKFSSRYIADSKEIVTGGHVNCFYQGEVIGYPLWTAVVSTCNGLRGSFGIADNESLFHIEPLNEDSDSLQQIHALYFKSVKVNEKSLCGMPHNITITNRDLNETAAKVKRQSTSANPIVELAVINDQAQLQQFKGNIQATLTRAIEIVNGVDNLYKPLGVRIALVDVTTWSSNKIAVVSDAATSLDNLAAYEPQISAKHDVALLLTGVQLSSNVIGIAYIGTMCTQRYAVSVVEDYSSSGAVSSTAAHELGHLFNMQHDSQACQCPQRTCIMSSVISNPPPTLWSSCSQNTIKASLKSISLGSCLNNQPVSATSIPTTTVPVTRLTTAPPTTATRNTPFTTFSPTTQKPTQPPTFSSTTQKPTQPPTFSPTTQKPTQPPTFSPTTQKPTQPPTFSSTTQKPTQPPTSAITTIQPSTHSNSPTTLTMAVPTTKSTPSHESTPSVPTPQVAICGNGVREGSEACDCGSVQECKDDCCNATTCQLSQGAVCAGGPCCEECQFVSYGTICRQSLGECDIAEYCQGNSAECPRNQFVSDGSPCAQTFGYCYNGTCPTRDSQCKVYFGQESGDGPTECYTIYNTYGNVHGNCGGRNRRYIQCSISNAYCGSLQCTNNGLEFPQRILPLFVTVGIHYYRQCKSFVQALSTSNTWTVNDGTKCGTNMVCMGQQCKTIQNLSQCPITNRLICAGHGVCTNNGICACDVGFTSSDCSVAFSG